MHFLKIPGKSRQVEASKKERKENKKPLNSNILKWNV